MSYRNPTQYIDRQSGQIEQNLQKTLGGIGTKLVSDVNKIHEENARQVRAIKAAADERVAKSQYSIEQTESKNPTTDFGNLQPKLSRMNAILLKDPAKRTYEEKSFVTSMENIGDSMANMLKNTAMSQEATIDLFDKKIGTPGSVDPKQDPKLYAKLSVLANQTEGYTKAVYTTQKNGVVRPSLEVWGMYKGEITNLGSVINDNTSTTQMPPIIPDITKEMTEAINVVMNSNDFVSRFGDYIKEKGAFVGEDGKSMGYKVPEDYFEGKLRSEARTILAGLTPRDRISLYNNTLDKGKEPDIEYNDTLEGENSDDKNKKIEDALVSSLMRQTKATNDIFAKTNIVKKDTPTPPKKITEGDYKRLSYKNKVKYLDGRFTPENVTFESAFELANEEGIKVEKILERITEEVIELKLGNTTINKNDSPEIIKKKLLIAGGVKNKDAEELINEQSLLFQPNIGTGNLPIKKID